MSNWADLQRRLDEMQHRVEMLEAEREIRELLARYGHVADLGLDEQYVDLYTADGSINLDQGDDVRVWEGRDSLMSFITGPSHRDNLASHCLHVQGNNFRVQVSGDDATAESYSMVLGRDADDKISVRSARMNRWTLKRADGEWKIKQRLIRRVGGPDWEHVLSPEA